MTKIDTLIKRSRDLLHDIQFSRFGHRCPCCHLPHHTVKCLLKILLDDLDNELKCSCVKPEPEPEPEPAKNAKLRKNHGTGK